MAKSSRKRLVIECLLVAVLGIATWQFYFNADTKQTGPGEVETGRDLKSVKFIQDRLKSEQTAPRRNTNPDPERPVDTRAVDAVPNEPVQPPEEEEGILTGVIVDENGNPASGPFTVSNIGRTFSQETITGEFRETLPPGRYTVVARGMYAGIEVQSAPEIAEIKSGETRSIELVLPAIPMGGIGLDFQKRAEWIEVLAVWDGGPAQQAGIQPGDLIIEIGGAPVQQLDRGAIAELMLGPVGSQVEMVMAVAEGDGWVDVPVTLTRAILDQ